MCEVPVKSVKKALDILSILLFEDIGRKGVELSKIAGKMRIPVNTAHNLLKTMAASGFVGQIENSRYIAGPKCEQIGRENSLTGKYSSESFRNCMRELSASVGEAVVFAILVCGRRVVAAQYSPDQMIKVDSDMIASKNIYTMPTGRVIVAYSSDRELSEIKSVYGNPEVHWDGVNDDRGFREQADIIRKTGICRIIPDQNNLASCACPVFDDDGNLSGALGCYAPLYRCPKSKQNVILKEMHQMAVTIGKII
ncbi:MAG: hypothetical protein JW808_05675 [Victivallales bacterium]|nr:hypothetical protein [Victivallales bacterium]